MTEEIVGLAGETGSAENVEGMHILLVDDVFTTGATIISLGETILRAVPSARLSVAVLATTRRSLRLEQ